MTGIDVEDNAVVNNIVEVLYEAVAPKTRKFSTLNGLTTSPHWGSTLLVHKTSSTGIVKQPATREHYESVWHAKEGF